MEYGLRLNPSGYRLMSPRLSAPFGIGANHREKFYFTTRHILTGDVTLIISDHNMSCQDLFSHEGLSPDDVALRRKRLAAKKAKNQKRRRRKKLKKKLKKENLCGICAKELCACDGECFNCPAKGYDACACIPTCNECYIRHFVGNARRCGDPQCQFWHVSCPGGCGEPYKVTHAEARWCFSSAPGLANQM